MNRTFKILLLTPSLLLYGAELGQAAGALLTTPNTGEYVYETHMPSAGSAVDKAQAFCRGRFGGGCNVVKTWGNSCLAIAHADGSDHSGWAVTGNQSQAVTMAMGSCTKYGLPCHVVVNKCG